MKKITQNLRWLVTLLTMIVSVGAWAEETTIATATFDGKNATYTTGWTTTGTGKGRTDCVIIGAGENITSPAFNLSGYSSVTITFTGRRYGTLSDSKATVDASIGGTSVGTIDFTPTKVGDIEGGITFTPTPSMTAASLVFTCTNATSAGSTHGAGIGSITIKGTTSGGTVVTKTLTSIAISGTYPTTFQQGDAFSHEGMTVTATYDDESTADVTSKATFSGYNMSSVGEQTVTVTYVEGEVAKTASYTITVNEKAPVIDYATLPFEFNGGKGDIETTTGLTQNGLGNDYSADNSKLKFDTTDDYLILKINESPGVLSFNITNNSFSGGTFKVQTSEDGESYTDLNTYTSISGTQSESFDNLGKDVRYIKWVYTAKSSGNVGLGNIQLKKAVPQIIVANATIDVDENEHEGTLALSYKNLSITDREDFGIQFYDANNVELTEEPDWVEVLVAEENGQYLVSYFMLANEGKSRTAYCKVYAMDDETNLVYSDLITIKQAAAPSDIVYTKVTSTDDLVAGGEYIIVNEDYFKAMSTTQNNNNRGATIISINDDIATINDDTQVFTLEGNSDGWYFYTGSGYIYASSKTSNNLKTKTEKGDDAKAVISIDDDKNATITFQREGRNTLMFNPTNNPQIFSCYASDASQKLVQLYKKVVEEETSPTVTIGDSKWATYVAEDNVTFPSGVSAYTVETIESDHVTLGVVSAVKEGTPILVYSENPGTYTLEVVEEGVCDETYNNQLKVSDGTVAGSSSIYALANQNNVVGFYPVSSTITIPEGKAYLDTSSAKHPVKGFLALGGVADAINNIAVENANGTIFNIAGQKVQNITKGGLYIVNGKKVIVK